MRVHGNIALTEDIHSEPKISKPRRHPTLGGPSPIGNKAKRINCAAALLLVLTSKHDARVKIFDGQQIHRAMHVVHHVGVVAHKLTVTSLLIKAV